MYNASINYDKKLSKQDNKKNAGLILVFYTLYHQSWRNICIKETNFALFFD